MIAIVFDAKLDRVRSEKGVAYGISRIGGKGRLIDIDGAYFYEIKNQVDSSGIDVMNYGYLTVEEEFLYIVANGLEIKKLKMDGSLKEMKI